MEEYPKAMYGYPGDTEIEGDGYDYIVVESKEEEKAHEKIGYKTKWKDSKNFFFAKKEAEEKVKKEAEEKVKKEAEEKAKKEAEEKAKKEAEMTQNSGSPAQ